jgi:hypothetical protein
MNSQDEPRTNPESQPHNYSVDSEGRQWYVPMENYHICHAQGCTQLGNMQSVTRLALDQRCRYQKVQGMRVRIVRDDYRNQTRINSKSVGTVPSSVRGPIVLLTKLCAKRPQATLLTTASYGRL